MNFNQVRQCKGQKDGKGYDLKLTMFATFGSSFSSALTQKGKKKCIVDLTDDAGETHRVHLVGNYLPDASRTNQRSAFLISSYDGTTQDGQPYIGYSGFWQSGDQQQTQQPTPQQRQQAPQQARQSTNAPNTTNNSIERQCAWKSACTVAASIGTMNLEETEKWAMHGLSFIQFGKPITQQGGQANPDYVGDNPEQIPEGSDPPF